MPAESTAKPFVLVPFPIVDIIPVPASILRINELFVSAMYIFPLESVAKSQGLFKRAAVANPPSPKPPAIVETVDPVSLRILLFPPSLMYILPAVSAATP